MTRKLTLFLVCAFEIALILIAVSSKANSSEPKLSKFEQEKFTETCFDTVQQAFSGRYFDVSNGYSYFEPDLAACKRSVIGKARQIDHLWRGG